MVDISADRYSDVPPAETEPVATRPKTRWTWMIGLVSVATFAVGGLFGAQAAFSTPDNRVQSQGTAHLAGFAPQTSVTTSTTTSSTTTTTTPQPAPVQVATPAPAPAPTPAPAPAPAATPASPPSVPAFGQATVWGCSAALAYLQTYAAPGFAFSCPGYAEGHEAMTCVQDTPQYPNACPNGPTIAIADACPQAYMNETANSWYLTGQVSVEHEKYGVSYASIDPFGACP